ncbi:MAG TPA: DUF4326 domain-containing protein [Acidimicrobiales bacterium]|nr:DUF4326 domain-containing protein [Acidimicrobiales bacterium]
MGTIKPSKWTAPGAPPRRVQRKRAPGWRMPPSAVCVGRPTRWGNPYRVGVEVAGRAEAVERYRAWLGTPGAPTPEQIHDHLTGRDLCCWCPPGEPCHADMLLELANGAVDEARHADLGAPSLTPPRMANWCS